VPLENLSSILTDILKPEEDQQLTELSDKIEESDDSNGSVDDDEKKQDSGPDYPNESDSDTEGLSTVKGRFMRE
jgi:hypothetical protein